MLVLSGPLQKCRLTRTFVVQINGTKIATILSQRIRSWYYSHCRAPREGGGGGTLIFSYIRRLGSFFGFKILNFNILGFSEK